MCSDYFNRFHLNNKKVTIAMDILFLSKRMFIDNEFVNGGILVTPKGKIRSVMRSQQEVNSWMYANEADEVCQFNKLIIFRNSLQKLIFCTFYSWFYSILSVATSWS